MGLPGDKHEQIGPPHDKPKSRGTAKRLWHKLKGKDDEADTASTNPIAEPPSTFVQKSPDNIPNIGAAKSKLAKGKDVLNGPTSLWDSAYDALKSANPALVEKYEALLSKQSRAVASEQTERSSHWRPERIENSVKSASNQIDNNLRPSGSASDGQPGQAKDTLNDINNQIKNDLTPSGSGSIDQASAPDDLKGVNSQINNLCISDRRALLTSVAKAGLERLEKKKIRYQIVSENCLEDA
ncbi:hypothetical protein MMC10_011182, partial [Thelotrema lepadinum]|nr:hypothetical protein [Thelotrema lepadinum]